MRTSLWASSRPEAEPLGEVFRQDLLDQLTRALGVVFGHPQGDLTAAKVGLGREAHVVDVDPRAGEGESEVGDHAGAVGHDDADLAQRSAGHADVQQGATLRAGGRLPGSSAAPSPAASSARASASSSIVWSRPWRTASRLAS